MIIKATGVTPFPKIQHVFCLEFMKSAMLGIGSQVPFHFTYCHSFTSSWGMVGLGMNICLLISGFDVGLNIYFLVDKKLGPI